eukprot:GHVH01008731.1.p1 GENE.GHVH01008731.1~~GHVH01008731.1.p1  ORF type:complete len:385 (+),score=51.34 GHVH01008731.1:63-1217(+)
MGIFSFLVLAPLMKLISTINVQPLFLKESRRRRLAIELEGVLQAYDNVNVRDLFTGKSDLSQAASPWRRSENFDAQKVDYYNQVRDLIREKESVVSDVMALDSDSRDGYMLDIMRGGIGGAIKGITGDLASDVEDDDSTGLDGQQLFDGGPRTLGLDQRFLSRDRLVGEWAQKLYIHSIGGDIVHDPDTREMSVRLGNDEFWGGVGIGLEEGVIQNSWGVRNLVVQQVYDELINEIGASVGLRNYHVGVDHSQALRSSAIDVKTKRVDVSTLTKVEDRDYGQRVKVKNTGIMVRHDFDNYLGKDPDGEAGTEVHVEYKNLYISTDTDFVAKKAGVAVGIGGNKVAILRDTDDRNGYINVLMNGGWQWLSTFDVPDPNGGTRQFA